VRALFYNQSSRVWRKVRSLAAASEFSRAAAVVLEIPGPKRGVYLSLDPDVLDWFKAQGAGYQTRVNPVLRAFVDRRQRVEHARQKSEQKGQVRSRYRAWIGKPFCAARPVP